MKPSEILAQFGPRESMEYDVVVVGFELRAILERVNRESNDRAFLVGAA